jgi:hypothetical protein
VTLTAERELPFWSFFTGESPTVAARAAAALVRDGEFCMMATEEDAVTAISMGGNSTLNLGCGIATNATGDPAIDAKGNTKINAAPLIARGTLDPNNSKYGTTNLLPNAPMQKNPYAHLPDPSTLSAGMNCEAKPVVVDGELGPGCFSEMNLGGTVRLKPGTYYVKNADIVLESSARITGTEVTIVLTGDGDKIGTLNMKGQAQLSVVAPKSNSTTADYPGMAIVRDDDRENMDVMKVNGGQGLRVTGGIYLPRTHFWLNGNGDLYSSCLQLVAQQLTFLGGAKIDNKCDDGYGESFRGTFVRLVS